MFCKTLLKQHLFPKPGSFNKHCVTIVFKQASKWQKSYNFTSPKKFFGTVTYFSFMVLLSLLSSTVHGFPSLQLGVVEWGINPNLPTMSGYICGFTSMAASSEPHEFLRGNCTLVHVFASISLGAHSHRSVPGSRIPHTAAQQGPAPLQGPLSINLFSQFVPDRD